MRADRSSREIAAGSLVCSLASRKTRV